MKTLRKVEIKTVFTEFIPDELEQDTFYISKEYNVAVHLCLCGCLGKSVTPLKNNGWNLIEHEDGKISLNPSILNSGLECKSHYVLNRNVANIL